MIEVGQMLSETTPAGVNAIFERFRNILHEGHIQRRVQYTIEKLFAIRKKNFCDNPGVTTELDLIEEQDKITHNISLDDELFTEDKLNLFKFDPDYQTKETQWDEIKKEILGEYYSSALGAGAANMEEEDGEGEEEKGEAGVDTIDRQNVSCWK